ncbi:MAG: nucleoside triphosphate pyrophosphohydrolase family protein [Lachnospiraceae bacterium]|nr:nucleoside triphosphate pyrophosphohydrolase family protein [Lachnospiraceae bacterium]
MTGNEYQKIALKTAEEECRNLNNLGLGLMGESGKAGDAIKKYLWQHEPLDKEYIVHKLGGVLWYMAVLADVFGMKFDDIFKDNIEYIKKKYPNLWEQNSSKSVVKE